MYNIISINPRLIIITAIAANNSEATLANALGTAFSHQSIYEIRLQKHNPYDDKIYRQEKL